MMKLTHLILPILLAVAVSPAWAADKGAQLSSLETALTDCANKVKKDSEGMPDQKAMAQCMKAKGFGSEADPNTKAKSK